MHRVPLWARLHVARATWNLTMRLIVFLLGITASAVADDQAQKLIDTIESLRAAQGFSVRV